MRKSHNSLPHLLNQITNVTVIIRHVEQEEQSKAISIDEQRAYDYLKEHQNYYPDDLTDSTRKRKRKTAKRVGDSEVLQKFLAGNKELLHVVLPFGVLNMYSRTDVEQVKAQISKLFDGCAYLWKIEQGLNNGLHAHIIIPAQHRNRIPAGIFTQAVTDAVGLLEYWAKPNDARACRTVKDWLTGQRATPTREQRFESLVDYLSAREAARRKGERLPRKRGYSGLRTAH